MWLFPSEFKSILNEKFSDSFLLMFNSQCISCNKGDGALFERKIPSGRTANIDIKVNSLGIFFPRFGSEVAYFVSNL